MVEAAGTHPFIAGLIRAFLALLMGMVAVVLLIACANVANLMLARVFSRSREIAVRAALGAGRWRIARVFLAESMLLAVLGGVSGLLLAWWATRLLSAFRPDIGIPVDLALSMDVRVLLFTLVVTLATALVFGVVPALRAAGMAPFAVLRESGSTASSARARLRTALVVAQVALSALLMFGAGLLVRSLSSVRGLDPGFDVADTYVLSASPELLGYDDERGRALWRELVARVRRLPGVRSASLALFVPMGDRGDQLIAMPAEAPWPAGAAESPPIPYNIIEPGYFDTMGMTLVRGRDVSGNDNAESEPVAIVSAAAAARWWRGEDAVGRRIRMVDRDGEETMLTVIGVAPDVGLRAPGSTPDPLFYVPFTQRYRPDMMLHVRGDGGPGLPAILLGEVRALEPGLPVKLRTLAEASSFRLIPLRVAGSVLGGAGALGLFLAATGVFGIVAWSVSRQSREMAIRLALGANRWRVRRMVIARALKWTGIGLLFGISGAVIVARLLQGLLYGVSTTDPLSLLSVGVLFTLVTILAAWAPALRASRADPAAVLREE
jgi:predicted permease